MPAGTDGGTKDEDERVPSRPNDARQNQATAPNDLKYRANVPVPRALVLVGRAFNKAIETHTEAFQ